MTGDCKLRYCGRKNTRGLVDAIEVGGWCPMYCQRVVARQRHPPVLCEARTYGPPSTSGDREIPVLSAVG